MSWIRRQWQRLREKILGEKASPEFIARGWAIGMFYGCAIPFGFQLILSIPTAILLKGSKIGATVATFVTNHFTIFIIYPVQCWVGNRLLGGGFSYGAISHALHDVVKDQSWDSVLQLGEEPLVYFGVLAYVRRHRARVAAKHREEKTNG